MLSRDCLIQVLYFLSAKEIISMRLVCGGFNEIVKQCQFVERRWQLALESVNEQLEQQIFIKQEEKEKNHQQKQKFYECKIHEKDLQIIRKQLTDEITDSSKQTIKILCGYLNNGYLEDRFQDEQLECLYYLKHPNILKQILKQEENFEEISDKQFKILCEVWGIDQGSVREDSFAIHICLIYLQNLCTLLNTPYYCSHRSIRNLQELRLNIISNVQTLQILKNAIK